MPKEVSSAEHTTAVRTDIKLTEESFLTDDFVRQLMSVGEIDILIGLPTHNNAKTITASVAAVQDGILRWFPRERLAAFTTRPANWRRALALHTIPGAMARLQFAAALACSTIRSKAT